MATVADGEIAEPGEPPLTSQEALSVRISIPAVDETMDLIELSTLETKVPVMALVAWTGSVMSKLKYDPGWDRWNVCGAPGGPARTRRCWKNAGTVGLPLDVAERVVVAVAAPEEKLTVGGVM